MQLGHRVAELVRVPLHQLFVKVLDREIGIVLAIEPQHAQDLVFRRPPARRLADPPVDKPLRPLVSEPIAPAAERPLAHPQHLRRFDLVQLAPLVTLQQRFEPHPADLLQHLRPDHSSPPTTLPGAIPKPDRSRATKSGQITRR
jgi:hypothetical protein